MFFYCFKVLGLYNFVYLMYLNRKLELNNDQSLEKGSTPKRAIYLENFW
jgi:hypothetical protein